MNEITIDLYEKLDELRKTRFDKKTYRISKSSYSPTRCVLTKWAFEEDNQIEIPLKCEKCKKEIRYKIFESESYFFDEYKHIISDFNLLGVDAKLVCHCEDCCENGWHAKPIEIWLKDNDDKFYNKTYPIEFNSGVDERYNVRIQEYIIALNFLRACVNGVMDNDLNIFNSFNIPKKNISLSYAECYYDESIGGFIKPIVDLALYKVLNLNITYDREELKDSIKFLLKEHTENACYGFIFEDDDTIPISKQKYEKLVAIVEDIIDNKKLEEISVYDYFNFVKSLQFIFEYDGMHSDGYKDNYVSLIELKNQGYFNNEDI